MANGHDFRVAVLLTAEEYMALKASSDEEGLSQSAFIRNLVKKEIRDRALKSVCADSELFSSSEATQVLHKAKSAA